MKQHLFLLFLIFSFSTRAEVIKEDGLSDNFSLHKSQNKNNIQILVKDLKDRILSEEQISLDGDQFKTYRWKQFQTGETVFVELIDNKLHFESDKKKKTITLSSEELKRLVLPPLLTSSLQKRIEKSPQAKAFDVVVIVPDKMLTLDFEFEQELKNENGSVWVLSPANFFVGLIVSPVTIEFNKNLKLKKIKNITLPIRPTQKTDIIFK